MERNYFLELDPQSRFYTVHHDNCPHNRARNRGGWVGIGLLADDRAALVTARERFSGGWGREYCCCFSAHPAH